jgi:hypothetical protein
LEIVVNDPRSDAELLVRDYILMPREAGFGAAVVVGRGPFK